MTSVKICGLSDLATLQAVLPLAPDFVGFVYYPSSVRHVDVPVLATLVNAAKGHTKSVVVMVNPDDALLDSIFAVCQPDYIQLHGDETPARAGEIKARYSTHIIKSIALSEPQDLTALADYENIIDAVLFDTKLPAGVSGGSGKTFDWELLRDFSSPLPWFLSGGLSGDNISQALSITRAPAVDVSSHVETPAGSGKKDIEKISTFMDAVKTAH